ncbi:MAG: DNA polymerase/3'-5' exonuclease PolX [Candidatus Hydrogenedentes bacterium]|nr:DNA polymerase/3'-5' exonuclease PolX [Candidatus Hydrogenedentota bacterium]
MDKAEIIRALRELSLYLEIDGENPFKIRSYLKAADTLEHTQESIEELINTNKLRELEGIGEAIEKKIISLYKGEPVPALEKMRNKYPESLLSLFSIPFLGGKRIKVLFEHLNIKTIEELKNACLEGKIANLPGFNKKIENKILKGVELISKWEGFHLIDKGYEIANEIVNKIVGISNIDEVYIVGSVRRFTETINNVDIMVVTQDKSEVIKKIEKELDITTSQKSDSNSVEFIYKNIKLNIHFSEPHNKYTKLFYYTGSKDFVEKYKFALKRKGFEVDKEFNIFHHKNRIEVLSENAIFELLNEPYLPPEVREILYEEDILKKRIDRLIKEGEIKGIVHCHSNYSDGHNTIEELAEYCKDNGYEYLVVCDHSQSAGYAKGLNIDTVRKQHDEIENLNIKLKPFKIFKGIECDIRLDGTLDYPNDILTTFDIVVVSVHSKLEMDENIATQRITCAINNPFTHILGHPSGRLLLTRAGYPLNYEKIFDECLKNNVAIEINAQPQRLDLDWKNVYKGMCRGLKFVITTDAHDIPDMRYLSYGVSIARKGLLTPEDVLNTYPAEEFINWFKKKKR